MLTLCEGKYSVERDLYQWILHEWYMTKGGKNSKGQMVPPRRESRDSYHARLDQVMQAVLEREIGNSCENLQDVLHFLNEVKDIITVTAEKELEFAHGANSKN